MAKPGPTKKTKGKMVDKRENNKKFAASAAKKKSPAKKKEFKKKTKRAEHGDEAKDLELFGGGGNISDGGNVSDGGDMSDGDPGGSYGKFIQKIAAIEGNARFLHHSEDVNLDMPLAQLLGENEDVSVEAMIKDLPNAKKIRKSLQSAAGTPAPAKKKTKKQLKEDDSSEAGPKRRSLKLPAPLSAPAATRVERTAVYSRAKEDVAAWDSVVHARRAAEHVTYPLNKPDMRMATAKEHTAAFKPRTPLEEEVMSLLHGSKSVVKTGQELSEREESALARMTLHEAEERRKDLARLKALQSYQEQRMRRQNKIKSKRFRRGMRKQRQKEKERELDELSRTNPELAAERLAEAEKARMEERATLKHRSTSKFMQMQARRAGHDKESQAMIANQLRLHRDLTSKVAQDPDEDGLLKANGEDEEDTPQSLMANVAAMLSVENPWIAPDAGGKVEVTEGVASASVPASTASVTSPYKKETNKPIEIVEVASENSAKDEASGTKEKKVRRKNKKSIEKEANETILRERLEMVSSLDDLFEEAESIMKDKLKARTSLKRKLREDEEDSDEDEPLDNEKEDQSLPMKTDAGEKVPVKPKEIPVLKPDVFVTATNVRLPEMDSDQEENDDEVEQSAAIAEAFANDDVIVDFRSEKDALVNANRPKNIDLTLPGWGDWGGHGLAVSKRKRKRFTIRAPPAPKRRDENKAHLILNVDKESGVRPHQVTSVPFPFTSVADFEASIRTPVGETFVPRTAFKKLVRPRVETKMGVVIEAMDKEELVKRNITV